MGIPFVVYPEEEAGRKSIPSSSNRDGDTAARFRHFYLNCELEEWKLDTLMDLLESAGADEGTGLSASVVFANSPEMIRWLYTELSDKFPSRASRFSKLHAGMSSAEVDARLEAYVSRTDKHVLIVDPLTFCSLGLDSLAPQLWIDFELPDDGNQHELRLRTNPPHSTRILISLTCDLEMPTLRSIQENHCVEELPDYFQDFAPDLFYQR